MSNGCFHVFSDASSGTLAIFTAFSGLAILLLIRLWKNRARYAMDPPPELQSVEIEVTRKFYILTVPRTEIH